MKKLLLSLAILAALAVMPANAQIKFGIKGGMNYPDMKLNYNNLVHENVVGWFAGPTLKAIIPLGPLPLGLGADIGAFYDERRTKTEYDGIEETIKQKSILVPLNARLNLGLGESFGIYVTTGPQFGFNVGNKDFNIFGDNSDEAKENYKSTFQLKKSNFSWNFGFGIMLLKHLELGAAYSLGIGKTGEIKGMTKEEIEEAPKQKSWVFSAAYYF